MSRIKTLAPGIAVSALIAVVCWFLGQAVPLVGGAVFAILLGMVIGTFWKERGAAGPGIKFASKKILQTAVVLLGFGLPLTQLAQVGAMSLPVILSTISASLITAAVLCRVMHVPGRTATLIGVGSSICGGSAIAATAPVIKADDLVRMESVPGNYFNFHPGSHVKQGAETGIELISGLLNEVLRPEQTTTVLLETMAGKGTEVGHTFEELAAIIDRVELSDHMGVCLDTCHIHDGGYDIVNDLDGVLDEFDRVIGLDRLRAVHINDSKNPCGAHKDRHECIGQGFIGVDAFQRIVTHPALRDLPLILETPNELPGYAAEIKLLRELAERK